MSAKQLERVRRICMALSGTTERISHGEPTFFVGKKVYVEFRNNHHGDGHEAVCVPAPLGLQEVLIEASPQTFFRPPYGGVRGWVGIELEHISDEDLAGHIHEAWRMIAPKKLLTEADTALASIATKERKVLKGKTGRRTL